DEGGGPGGCFIATAAFGSYENRWVYVLRDFRDQVLLEHGFGRAFVEWYYAHSPGPAAWIAEHDGVRAVTRLFLAPLIAAAWFWLYVPPLQKALVLLVVLALVFRKRIRRRFAGSRAA
ncbi:MAG TPA: CFI-box-CTERM domain-containing protein, partial [Polyangia bacterium]